ncbi:DNA primase [Candidatus Peregrinibacteria bacterium]|nr:DNA primase [Candidatus Peregrinibacteria bacterium]
MLSSLDEIRSRLSIEEVVGGYVALKKVGRNFKALCPFHNEKTPSFVVSTEKQLAYCFGCHRGGDIFKFVQEVEGVDFKEALQMLAEKAGVKLDTHASFRPSIQEDAKERLRRVMEEACQFFTRMFWETEPGKKVYEYMKARGMLDDTLKIFRVGYALDSFDALQTHLYDKGFQKEDLLASGLVRSQDTLKERVYDYFRGRLIFPIMDTQGRVIAFGARALKKDDHPKYLNSPDTPLYKKSATLYGFSHAKEFLKKEKSVVFVEGYMDVLASHQSGIKNVVASSGTALSREQLVLVKRFVSELLFCFDTDSAGKEATERAFEMAQGMDFILKVVSLPLGKDPGEFVQSGGDFNEQVLRAEPYLDFCFRTAFENFDATTPAGLRSIQDRLLPLLKRVLNSVERDRHVKRLAHLLSTDAKYVYESLEKTRISSYTPVDRGFASKTDVSVGEANGGIPLTLARFPKDSTYEYFFGLLYQYPQYFSTISALITADDFPSPYQDLYKKYQEHYNVHAHFDREVFEASISLDEAEKLKISALKVEMLNETLSTQEIEDEINKVALWIREKFFILTRKKMLNTMRRATEEGSDQSEHLFQEYCQFLQQRTQV